MRRDPGAKHDGIPVGLRHASRSSTLDLAQRPWHGGGTLAPSTMAYQLAPAMPLVHGTSLIDPGMRGDPGAKHDGIPVGPRHASSTGISLRDIDSTLAAGRHEVGLESSPGCETDFATTRSRVEPRMRNTDFATMRSRVEPRMQNTAFTTMRSRVEPRMRKPTDFTTMRSRVELRMRKPTDSTTMRSRV
jgi:hypothetical protein